MESDVNWPEACWGCGTSDNLQSEQGAIELTVQKDRIERRAALPDRVHITRTQFRLDGPIFLCPRCREYAIEEQGKLKLASLFAVLASLIIVIIPSFWMLSNLVQSTDLIDQLIGVLLSFLSTCWVPLAFVGVYNSFRRASPYHSYYQLDLDTEGNRTLHWRNRTFYEKFVELNPSLQWIQHKPVPGVANTTDSRISNCVNMTCLVGICCCFLPFVLMSLLVVGTVGIVPTLQILIIFPVGPVAMALVIGFLIQNFVSKRFYESIKYQYPGIEGDT